MGKFKRIKDFKWKYLVGLAAPLLGYVYHLLYREERSVRSRLMEDRHTLKERIILSFHSPSDYNKVLEEGINNAQDLTPPRDRRLLESLQLKEYFNGKIWTYTPKENLSNRLIIYFAGGHRVHPLGEGEWRFISRLSEAVQARIIIPYAEPLNGKWRFREESARLAALVNELSLAYCDEEIHFLSSDTGAMFALQVARDLRKDVLIEELIVMSPWLTSSNEGLDKAVQEDHDYGIDLAKEIAIRTLWEKVDESVDLSEIETEGTPCLRFIVGTYDRHYEQVKNFYQRMKAVDPQTAFYSFDSMPHDFHLLHLLEAKEAQNLVAKIIQSPIVF